MTEWTEWHELHSDKIELVAGIDCWIWMGGRTSKKGHGRVRFAKPNGEKYSEYSHRAAYISLFGWPKDGSFICHKCGNGLCVRPSHLYEGDALSNGKDAAEMLRTRGTLTYDDAYDIRVRYKQGESLQSIADRYNIAFGSVYPIVMGKSYKHAPFPSGYEFGKRFRKPLSQEEVSNIRKMLAIGVTQREIALAHNIASSIISRINTGDRHKNK